jgi:hypothetical protein
VEDCLINESLMLRQLAVRIRECAAAQRAALRKEVEISQERHLSRCRQLHERNFSVNLDRHSALR